jgi:hypothetical protein
VAAAVWRRARANAGVEWGGVSYARVDALARRGEST